MKVLITGASGFLGKNQILHCARDWEITAVYLSQEGFPNWLKHNRLDAVKAKRCDLTDPSQVKNMFKETYDAVIHFAANGDPAFSVADPLQDLRKTTETTINLLCHGKFERFIYFSSGAVYDGAKGTVEPSICLQPHLPYAISNLASEYYVHSLLKNHDYVIVRFFGAYGPYEPDRKIFTKLVQAFGLRKEKHFTIHGDGKNWIDAMYVSDANEIIKRIVKEPIVETLLNVGVGKPVTLLELVQKAADIFGIPKLDIRYDGEVPEFIEFKMDPAPLKEIYQFVPQVSLAEGLKFLKKSLEK